MSQAKQEMPEINQRIERLIWELTRGNVSKFASMIGFSNGNKINRLFKPDPRSGKYPEPSLEIVTMIVNKLKVDFNWLMNVGSDQNRSNPLEGVNIINSKIEGGSHKHEAASEVNYNQKESTDLMPIMQQLLKTIEKKEEEIAKLKETNDKLTSRLLNLLSKGINESN